MLMSPDSSILAFSAASLSRCMAWRSPLRSIPVSFLNSLTKYSTILLSKSSPPRLLLPLVALTSKTPSPSSKMETSKDAAAEVEDENNLVFLSLSRP